MYQSALKNGMESLYTKIDSISLIFAGNKTEMKLYEFP